ncbi:MAG: TonB-dependent receptor [Acidobacteria bacterium]|nr:TonB-dependent receptor [Acidobacteriota bacterium]
MGIRVLAALACVLILGGTAYAQTASISGTVVDESGAAVPGASVQLAGAQARFTTTGPAGDYAFRNLSNGTYQITVTLSGFAPGIADNVVVGAANAVVPPITLKIARVDETVVVSASKVESRLIDSPVSMSVVSGDVLASTPALSYGDLLRAVPGVNVIQLSARDVNLTSRQATGTLSNSQLVLLDGRSIYLDFFGIVLWDFVPTNLSDIRQIEVIRGPASAVWGANAMTGVVNIITKSPREARGSEVTLSGGLVNRNAGSTTSQGLGNVFSANATYADAPNDVWSYRVSAGYFNSDPYPRPTGQIPVITDPRDAAAKVGGAFYPADNSTGAAGTSFANAGTSQPKFDMRVDQEVNGGGRVTYEGGVAGTRGIIYTGIGPFDIQPGSYMGYTKVNYSKAALKVNFFGNFTNSEAPNLLLTDPATGKPLQLNFSTQTYDVEAGDSIVAGARQVWTFGGNVRRNNFNLTIAPAAQNRTEAGAYLQDEILLDRVRFTLGGRVDKFGNLGDPVFSPRLAAVIKATRDHSFRVSFNKAFRSPSVVNNYLDTSIVVPTDLSGLAPLLPAPLQPAVAKPFPLVVKAVGSQLPIGSAAQPSLTEESLTAYEVAYSGTIQERTSIGVAFYVNDLNNSINFTQLSPSLDPYTAASPPPGWALPASVLAVMASRGILLPRTAFTYLNLGPIRQKGFELSVDSRIARSVSAYANYSWQGDPVVLADAHPFPAQELALPPTNRFNTGVNYDGPRLLGSASVSYADRAFWSDVLTSAYHGFSGAYTLVGGAFGVKWDQERVITLVKVNNILNQDVQQHVFGDILKTSAVLEVRFKM